MDNDIILTEKEVMEKQSLIPFEKSENNWESITSYTAESNCSGLVFDYERLLRDKQAEISRLTKNLQEQYKIISTLTDKNHTLRRGLMHLASYSRTNKLQKEMINYLVGDDNGPNR